MLAFGNNKLAVVRSSLKILPIMPLYFSRVERDHNVC